MSWACSGVVRPQAKEQESVTGRFMASYKGLISRITIIITPIRGLISPLTTTREPPRGVSQAHAFLVMLAQKAGASI